MRGDEGNGDLTVGMFEFGHLTNQEMAEMALRFVVFLTAIFLCNGAVFMTLLFICFFSFSIFIVYDPIIYFHGVVCNKVCGSY